MPAVIVRKVISSAMSNRESVGSFSESQRAKAKRPDPRNILPQTGQSDTQKATGAKATDAADAYEHILTIQNAADLEFPAIPQSGTNAPERAEFKLGLFRRIITSRPQRRRRHPRHLMKELQHRSKYRKNRDLN